MPIANAPMTRGADWDTCCMTTPPIRLSRAAGTTVILTGQGKACLTGQDTDLAIQDIPSGCHSAEWSHLSSRLSHTILTPSGPCSRGGQAE
jgi:hypothetical protein